jgi:hypothetical protein
VVEDVEHIGLQLNPSLAGQRQLPGNGDVRVDKARSDDDVAAQGAEPVDRRERRGIEPAIRRAENANRPDDVGPDDVGDPGQAAVAGDDVDRVAALRLNDDGDLPAARKDMAAEGQHRHGTDDNPWRASKSDKPYWPGMS